MEYPWSFFFCRLPESAMAAGQVIETEGLRVTVLAVNRQGRPVHVRFSFDRPLEDASLRWYTWNNGGYRPFEIPAVGQTTTVPGLPISTAIQQIVESQLTLSSSPIASDS